MENQLPDLIKQAPKILPMIYKDLAQPSVRKVGKALETVFEFSTSMLLPLKLLNEKVKINFERNLNDYKKKIEKIPEEKICDVNPQIGTPIIEKLTYTTNEEIADLFTTLLSKATSTETLNQAHPSFVQMIERLSVDEARLIKYLRHLVEVGTYFIPCVSFRLITDGYFDEEYGSHNYDSFIDFSPRETELTAVVQFMFPQNINIYIDNFISLGIFNYNHKGDIIADEAVYESIKQYWCYEAKYEQYVEDGGYTFIECVKGHIDITELGELFIIACTTEETNDTPSI